MTPGFLKEFKDYHPVRKLFFFTFGFLLFPIGMIIGLTTATCKNSPPEAVRYGKNLTVMSFISIFLWLIIIFVLTAGICVVGEIITK